MNSEMNTIVESRSPSPEPTTIIVGAKAASSPVLPKLSSEEVVIKTQLSAPSHFFSLKYNEAPPFKKPEHEPRATLLIDKYMTEGEAVEMIAASQEDPVDGLRKFLAKFLVEKKIVPNFALSERNFLVNLMKEAIDYAAQRDFSALKLAILLSIYAEAHRYFKWYYWQPPSAVWNYFKDVMIRHTIEDIPDGMEIFDPDECYDIVTHFHAVYLSNLPLIHILTFGVYRLKLLWPFHK